MVNPQLEKDGHHGKIIEGQTGKGDRDNTWVAVVRKSSWVDKLEGNSIRKKPLRYIKPDILMG